MKILSLKAREILDSRSNPTIEVELATEKGIFVACAPSGASTGAHEALELRDGGPRRGGLGVLKAVKNIEEIIAPQMIGKEFFGQKEIDQMMLDLDGTENKSRLGANVMVAVSMAACRAFAKDKETPLYQYINEIFNSIFRSSGGGVKPSLPRPCFNVINGGAHAGNELDVQEFMIVPQADSYNENLEIGAETYRNLKQVLNDEISSSAVNVGDEGGFAPAIRFPAHALDLILAAIEKAGVRDRVKVILDVAASQFLKEGRYQTRMGIFTGEGLAGYYFDLISKYPIIGLEDPFAEDDIDSWKNFKAGAGEKLLVIADDLTVTNTKRMKMAQENGCCNAMILKINQIGTVIESLAAANLAKEFGWKIIVSHRSGETGDDFISDLAVGIGAEFMKSGAPARGERTAKYNRLSKIAGELQTKL